MYRDKTVVVMLTVRIAQANTRVVHIASCGRDDEEYWQCSVTYEANERSTVKCYHSVFTLCLVSVILFVTFTFAPVRSGGLVEWQSVL